MIGLLIKVGLVAAYIIGSYIFFGNNSTVVSGPNFTISITNFALSLVLLGIFLFGLMIAKIDNIIKNISNK